MRRLGHANCAIADASKKPSGILDLGQLRTGADL
jgi:hypothetical protein